MSLTQVVEDRNRVALIKQKLCANAADVTGATDDENFHRRENRRPAPLINPKCDSTNFSPTFALNSSPSPKTESNSKPPFPLLPKIEPSSMQRPPLRMEPSFAAKRSFFEPARVSSAERELGDSFLSIPTAECRCRRCARPNVSSPACSVCRDRSCSYRPAPCRSRR